MTQKRLLLLEDDIALRTQLEKVLAALPLEIVSAGNGLEGLAQIGDGSFHVIVTDIRMPVMDGIQFATQVREWGLDVPIIMLSGNADKDVAIMGIKLGALDFIEKPFRSKELLDAVEKALKLEGDKMRTKLEGLDLSQLHITILEMVFKGLTNKEIAQEVNLSEQGVKYHIGNLLEQFEVENRIDLKTKIRGLFDQKSGQNVSPTEQGK